MAEQHSIVGEADSACHAGGCQAAALRAEIARLRERLEQRPWQPDAARRIAALTVVAEAAVGLLGAIYGERPWKIRGKTARALHDALEKAGVA